MSLNSNGSGWARSFLAFDALESRRARSCPRAPAARNLPASMPSEARSRPNDLAASMHAASTMPRDTSSLSFDT